MRALLALLILSAPALAEPDAREGAALFRAYCAACHGEDARGDGPAAGSLMVAPPDLTGLAAANGGVFPVFDVVRRIDGRDPLLAHGGEMPFFGSLFEGEDMAMASEAGQPIMTTRPIADVAAYLAGVQE